MQELPSYISQKLAPYEVARQIGFPGKLPKTAVGKTLRRELAQAAGH